MWSEALHSRPDLILVLAESSVRQLRNLLRDNEMAISAQLDGPIGSKSLQLNSNSRD